MKNNDKIYYQLVPEKIYLSLDTLDVLLGSDIKGYSRDYLKEVISIVAFHIKKDENSSQLQMVYIKKMVPQGDKYLLGLIRLGLIKRTGAAIVGQTSYNYSFAPDYASKYIPLKMNNAKLIRRIELVHSKMEKAAALSIRGRSAQVKFLKHLSIEPEYINFLNRSYTIGTDQYNSAMASAIRIINNDIFYCIDNTSGRFHSNITNMSKGLRPFLRIDGQQLVNLDIKNSQPYMSTILLTNPNKVHSMTKIPAFALLLQTLEVTQTQDVKKYISLVNSGQLYEYLMGEFSKEGLVLTRAETKTQVLRLLFSRNRMPKDKINRLCRQIFRVRFPKVDQVFSKLRGSSKGDKFSNFKRFAILLQSIESHLIIDIILKRIYKELPGTIAVSIHDSIMTGLLTNNVLSVRKIMIEELSSYIGFMPNIKIEYNREEKDEEYKRIESSIDREYSN
ncbi:MAG: hypothetical protein H6Q12_619 [Bacteroidetes bacterium]|nr:hypothetical protein [Bacteroidota bacterium]